MGGSACSARVEKAVVLSGVCGPFGAHAVERSQRRLVALRLASSSMPREGHGGWAVVLDDDVAPLPAGSHVRAGAALEIKA